MSETIECEADNHLCACRSDRIEELKGQVEALQRQATGMRNTQADNMARHVKEKSELKAHTASLWVIACTLREHLNAAQLGVLRATPTQSLIEHDKTIRNKAIRECVEACKRGKSLRDIGSTTFGTDRCIKEIEELLDE